MHKISGANVSHRIAGIPALGLMLLMMLFMASCSEDDDSTYEWENWKSKNDTYWATLYQQTKQKIADGDSTWKIIPLWTLATQQSTTGEALSYDSTDYIIAHVETEGTGTESPLLTDTVQIHYLGRLIPSPSYSDGLIFDASYDYTNGYDLRTMRPYTGSCNSFISGFITALLNMHKGDKWKVYIPYQLAYGSSTPGSSSSSAYGITYSTSSSSSDTGIQPYSDLIFEITLANFYHHGETVPTVYSKRNIETEE